MGSMMAGAGPPNPASTAVSSAMVVNAFWGASRGYPKGEADPTRPKPLQPAVLDPVLISRRDFLLAPRTHM